MSDNLLKSGSTNLLHGEPKIGKLDFVPPVHQAAMESGPRLPAKVDSLLFEDDIESL